MQLLNELHTIMLLFFIQPNCVGIFQTYAYSFIYFFNINESYIAGATR